MKYPLYSFLFASMLLIGCGGKKNTPIEEVIRPVRYAKIVMSNAGSSNTFSGIAQSSKEASLSFKVAGTINKVEVKVGDRVRRGQLIAALDPIDYSIEYDQALAQAKNAETQIRASQTQRVTTKSSYERIEKLFENNSVSLSEYEQAKASYEAAESQYEAALSQAATARKKVEAAKNQVNYARLTAPYSGVITAVNAEENELIGSGNVVAVLSAMGQPEVQVGIPELFIGQIQNGQKVDIQFSILAGRTFKGTVSEVAFSASDASTYPVIIQIDEASENIRPGMAASVTIATGKTNLNSSPVLLAPAKAIGQGTRGNFAFLLQKMENAYQVKKTDVEIGELLNDGFEIKKGLQEGDLVATAGLQSLLDGMKVKLMEE